MNCILNLNNILFQFIFLMWPFIKKSEKKIKINAAPIGTSKKEITQAMGNWVYVQLKTENWLGHSLIEYEYDRLRNVLLVTKWVN